MVAGKELIYSTIGMEAEVVSRATIPKDIVFVTIHPKKIAFLFDVSGKIFTWTPSGITNKIFLIF
jgi:hypothetical protein